MNHDTENTPSDNTFQVGQRVKLADHLAPHFFGQTHGTVDRLPVGTRYQDVLVDIGHGVYWFAATDLTLDPLPELPQRIRGASLTPSYVEAEPSNLDAYSCPHLGCDFVIGAAGPVDIDDEDPFQLEVDAHRRSHEPVDSASHCSSSQAGLASLPRTMGATPTVPDDPRDAVLGIVGEVSAVALMEAARGFPAIFDSVVALVDLPRSDVAALLRRVADVMDGSSK